MLTFFQSFQHFGPLPGLHTSFDQAWLELPVAMVEKHDLLLARFDDGFLRDRQASSQVHPQLHVGIHVRLQRFIAIVEFEPNLGRAGLRVQGGIDKAQVTGQHGGRIVGKGDGSLLSRFDERQLIFLYVRQDPDMGKICNGIEFRARIHMRTC